MFMNKLLILLDMPKILEFGSLNLFFDYDVEMVK